MSIGLWTVIVFGAGILVGRFLGLLIGWLEADQ